MSSGARGWAGVLALVAAVHALSFLGTGPVDDDFIVYRYAQNWLNGEGLVFDPGERVEGFTVPLWTFLAAGGLALGVAPEVWSIALGVLASALTTWLFARAWDLERGRWSALLVATSPALAAHAVAGLGTVLLAGLSFGWFASYRRALRDEGSTAPATAWLAAACLLRAEMVLFAAPWILFEVRRRRGLVASLSLLPVALYAGWRWQYYGRLLPITYDVKKLPGFLDVGFGLDYLIVSTTTTGLLLLLPLAIVGMRRASGASRDADLCAGLGLLLHTLYVVWVGGDYLPLARFFVPTLPILYWLAARGAALTRGPWPSGVVALVIVGVQWTQFTVRPELERWGTEHHERWRAVGETLRETAAPDTSLALSPIGIIGFTSGLRIVDVLGVTNDVIARAEPDLRIGLKGHHRHDGEWVIAQEPDLVVLGNAVMTELPGPGVPEVLPWERSIWEAEDFRADYEPYWMPVEGSDPLIFFLRRGSPPPIGARPL